MVSKRSNSLKLAALAAVLFGIWRANAAEPAPEFTFERDVRPILKTHCFQCHGEGEKLQGGVDLRLRRFMSKETDDGPVMVPGKPQDSLMLKLIASGKMPKSDKKLTDKESSILTAWISSGAKTVRPEPLELPKGFLITEEDRQFWSFRPIRRPEAPNLKYARRVRTPVDAFVLAKLRERNLDFAPDAEKSVLIRRLYLDLLGFPPAPDAVDAFLADRSPDAYEQLVDRLLDSPSYGERWGRHWLDVAGYADSNGYAEADSSRPHAWRYRDYVVKSFNEDKPFNEFIVEQLAGDELAGISTTNLQRAAEDPKALELLTATGFLRTAPDGTGDGFPDENLAKNQVVAETIKIVGSSLLGLTVGCAQCHDHRYDPISQTDYYRLRAIFEPAYDWKNWRRPAERLASLYTAADRAKAEAIEVEARKQDEAAEKLRKELLERVFEREIAKLPEDVREAARTARNTPGGKRTPEQTALLKKYPSADVQGALDLYDPEANKKVQAEQAKAGQIRAGKPPEPMVMALTEVPGKVPATFLFARGDHEQSKQKVEPADLEVLGGKSISGEHELATSGRRLSYARWLASPEHPLVARVLANRFWTHHFGRGIVNTPGDFGINGDRPTHPELLDWLASDFVAGGWRLKRFHRLLVTSTVYRQSSRNDSAMEADPDNRLYARMKLRRMDAETVRDSILAVSGKLNLLDDGAMVPTAQDGAGRVVAGEQKKDGRGDPTIVEPIGPREFRRSVYVERRRSVPLTVFDAFDAPVMSPNCEARAATTVAQQSLLMLNDNFVAAHARHFAERIERESPGDPREQLRKAWRLAFSADPSETEIREGLRYLEAQAEGIRIRVAELAKTKKPKQPQPDESRLLAMASLCQALFCQNRFLYVE